VEWLTVKNAFSSFVFSRVFGGWVLFSKHRRHRAAEKSNRETHQTHEATLKGRITET
jgi:hypothetical protein